MDDNQFLSNLKAYVSYNVSANFVLTYTQAHVLGLYDAQYDFDSRNNVHVSEFLSNAFFQGMSGAPQNIEYNGMTVFTAHLVELYRVAYNNGKNE